MRSQHLERTNPKSKRRLLNILIAYESFLLLFLMILAMKVRNVGIAIGSQSDYKSTLLLIAFPTIWLISLSVLGAWDSDIFENRNLAYQRLISSSAITFLIFCSASYIFKISISRFVILFSLIGGTLLHLCLRWVFFVTTSRNNKDEINASWIIVGKDPEKELILRKLASEYNAVIYCIKSFESQSSFEVWLLQILDSAKNLNAENIYLLNSNTLTSRELLAVIWDLENLGISVYIPNSIGIAALQSTNVYMGNETWAKIQTPSVNDSMRVVKRVFDFFVAVTSVIILLPFFFIIALIIKITSKGPIFYIQKRIGRDDRLFNFLKFRTMYEGSNEIRQGFSENPYASMSDRSKINSLVTPFGRYLRRFSIDEFPQFLCVLLGTMSLVGPRPVMPEEESQMGQIDFRSHIIKPGLTGIWQTSGRKETSWEERMVMDIEYVQKWKFTLDLVIIGHTFRSIITGEGSY